MRYHNMLGLAILAVYFCISGALWAGTYSGGDGTSVRPYKISSPADWQTLMTTPGDWGKHFVLTADIDLEGEQTPVGNNTTPFVGRLDGSGYTIGYIDIYLPDSDYVGLFGRIGAAGQVKNLKLIEVHALGRRYVGGLCGANFGQIIDCSVTGTLSGSDWYVGGLCGLNNAGTVSRSYAAVYVFGESLYVGGLCGGNYQGTITCCYSSSYVFGDGNHVGGLCGYNFSSGQIHDSYATGIVTGEGNNVGGLCGGNSSGTISRCHASGMVMGVSSVGGLVGYNFSSGSIYQCYALGAVSGSGNSIGGLCGYAAAGTIGQCYAAGLVTGSSFAGGLCGFNSGTVSDCFWDMETTGKSASAGGSGVAGKTTAQMQTLETFTSAGWDFADDDGDAADWQMGSNRYPQLAWEIVAQYSGGSGTEADPYQIANKQDLLTMAAANEDYDKHFILTADIDLAGQTFTTAVIARDMDASDRNFQGASFRGTFDGRGHRIMNLTINNYHGDYVGLFGVNDGTIKNLTLTHAIVRGDWYAGLLAGDNWGTISHCFVYGSIDADELVGGIAAVNAGVIERCYANCDVYGTDTCGVAVGQNYGQVYQCSTKGSVGGIWEIGGLVGENLEWGSIRDCYSMALVACRQGGSPSKGAGGLVGNNNGGTFSGCYSAGRVISETVFASLGGLIGINSGECMGTCFWDVQASGQTSGVGEGSSEGVFGKTTEQMQTLTTFTDAGWLFFYRPVWMMSGQDYPRLIWHRPDMDGSGRMDLADFAILAAYWQAADCGFCGGADLTGDQSVDLLDLQVFAEQWLEKDAISNHVYWIDIAIGRDYEDVENEDDDEYVFELEVVTDETIVGLEFTTPAGKTFVIPNRGIEEETCVNINGLVGVHRVMGREYEDEHRRYRWFYEGEFLKASSLLDYGDGDYTITVTHEGGRREQTTVWFGIPGTSDIIPQPTQIPVFTSFANGSILTSPVTFAWEACTDPAADAVMMECKHKYLYGECASVDPITCTSFGDPVELPGGDYEAYIGYAARYDTVNSDDICLRVSKYTKSDYEFYVKNDASISSHVFEIEIEVYRDYESPDNDFDDTYNFECDIETDGTVSKIMVMPPGERFCFVMLGEYNEYVDEYGNCHEMGREYDSQTGRWEWWYEVESASSDFLTAYGDGEYAVIIYYTDGRVEQTRAWFGVPGTTDPIPLPTQRPEFTSINPASFVTSPVTFAWHACTDPAARMIWLDYEQEALGIDEEIMLSIDSTGLGVPVTMAAGSYEVCLGFETWYGQTNEDGIWISTGKYTESDYWIEVQ